MSLTKEQILSASYPPSEPLDVPEWGGTLYIGVMSGAERDRLESLTLKERERGFTHLRGRMAAYTIRDEHGKPMFTEADVPTLSALSSSALGLVYDVAARLNGLTKKDVDELEKN
jgi:hypothetical protein